METKRYDREYYLDQIYVINDQNQIGGGETYRINQEITRKILKNMDEDGNFSIDDKKIKGVVEQIIFYRRDGGDEEPEIEMGPHHFIRMGRPLKFGRTFEDILLEEL